MIGAIRLAELAEFIPAQHRGANIPFQTVSTDTRTLQPGDLFIALIGDRFDGHEYVAQAVEKGACAVVVSKPVDVRVPFLLVEDTTHALGRLGLYNRQRFDKPVVAVTGSSGKTTVKGMMASLLRQKNEVLVTRGNLNNHIGTPLTLIRIGENDEIAMLELGASAEGEIAYTANLAKPDVAILTNAEASHLEGFGDVETIARTKGEIIDALGEAGTAILNADSPFFNEWVSRAGNKKVFSFGLSATADIRAENITVRDDGCCDFTLTFLNEQVPVQMQVMGRHNVMNGLACAGACIALDMTLDEIASGLKLFTGVQGRLIEKKGINDSVVIDDSYNANPASVRAAIDVLATRAGERVFVLGDMAELGAETKIAHAEMGAYAREAGIETFLAIGEFSRAAVDAFGDQGHWFASHGSLVRYLNGYLKHTVTALVKGSRSAHMDRVVSDILAKAEDSKS